MIDQTPTPLDRYIRWKELQRIVPLSRDRKGAGKRGQVSKAP